MDPHFLEILLKFVDVLQKIVATFAFLVGGVWVLRNYRRNRTHVPRLQVEVKADIIMRENRRYLLTTIQIKTVGLSMIKLPPHSKKGAGPRGCGLMVSPLRDYEAESDLIEVTAAKEDVQTFDVLEYHWSIEPGLTIYQQKLIRLPNWEYDAFWVRLRVLAEEENWSAVAIATPASDPLLRRRLM